MGRWEGHGGSAFEQRVLLESFHGWNQISFKIPSNPNYFMRRRNLPSAERAAGVCGALQLCLGMEDNREFMGQDERLFEDFSMSITVVSLWVRCIKTCPCLVLLAKSFLTQNMADRCIACFFILFWANTTRIDKGEGIWGQSSLPQKGH